MVNCPNCKEEIDYLLSQEETISSYRATLNKSGELDYSGKAERIEPNLMAGESCFICPECEEIIAENAEEAIKLLKGGRYRCKAMKK